MQDIRWSIFWFFLIEIILFLIISNIYSIKIGLIICLAFMSCYLIIHMYWIFRLKKWLKSPSLSNLPHGTGIWQQIFTEHYQVFKKNKNSKKELVSALEQFTQAAEALVDGVVALNENISGISWQFFPEILIILIALF